MPAMALQKKSELRSFGYILMLSPKVARSTESCKLHWAKKSVCVACPATRSGSSARMAAPLLRDFLCPITLTPMQDPVVTADGTEALPSQPLLSHFPQPSHTHAAFPIDLPLSLHGKGMGRKGACGAPAHCWGVYPSNPPSASHPPHINRHNHASVMR
jgi:hypothetical protein